MRHRRTLGWLVVASAVVAALLLSACGGEADQAGRPASIVSNDEAPAQPAEGGTSPGDGESDTGESSFDQRKITRTANLQLSVDNILESVQKVEDIAVAAAGFVSSSNLAVTDGGDGEGIQTATMKIRVPASAYAETLRALRGIAKEVRSQNEESQEVTEEYTDLQSRLRNLQATEQRYLDLLNRAETIPDILSLEDRLNDVRGQSEQVQGRINVLNDLTDLATISVVLIPPVGPEAVQEDKGWAEEAWSASWDASSDVLVVVGSMAIAVVVFLPWIVVPGLIGFTGWRLFGRRITEFASRVSSPGGHG